MGNMMILQIWIGDSLLSDAPNWSRLDFDAILVNIKRRGWLDWSDELIKNNWLVVWNILYFFHSVGNVIIPTDELIFVQRGRYTTNQIWLMGVKKKGMTCRCWILTYLNQSNITFSNMAVNTFSCDIVVVIKSWYSEFFQPSWWYAWILR
jgi:hypothetical protein